MTILQYGFIFLAALAAGGMNAVAGGGSFFSFPTLLFVGVPPIMANATNTIALWPGVLASVGAYRRELSKIGKRLLFFSATSLIGGGVGALLLLRIQETTFSKMIPFLLLLATVIFASSGWFNRWQRNRQGRTLGDHLGLVLLLQLLIAIYGGFFGGGIGIMMLALLSVSGLEDMLQMNALKLVLNVLINGVAVIIFVVSGVINWPAALVMIVGSVLGGYGGAVLAQRVKQIWVRRFVVAVGAVLTVYFFDKYWL